MNSWDVFLFFLSFFVILAPSQTPQLHSRLTESLPSQTVALPFVPIELISAFWGEKMMPSLQYFITCSAAVGRVIQPRAGLPFSGGCRLHFPPLPSLLLANQERLHSIQSSVAQQLSFFTICYHIFSPSVCQGWEGGRSASQICTLTQAITCYIWPHVETDVCERSFPGRDLIRVRLFPTCRFFNSRGIPVTVMSSCKNSRQLKLFYCLEDLS